MLIRLISTATTTSEISSPALVAMFARPQPVLPRPTAFRTSGTRDDQPPMARPMMTKRSTTG
ncbi:hypothetical protein [Micromonospora craniellae]|uniref:hypothetical protein n=1 Tax=Micromonospora craniellae TaxID=2294034 RepID=UPI001CC603F5|nr:hypothetical protein [Micromonospora craniellae]